MKDYQLNPLLLTFASPSSYVTVYSEKMSCSNYQTVPVKVFDDLFGPWSRINREHLVRIFLEKASDEDKIAAVLKKPLKTEEKAVLSYESWESWQKTKKFGESISFAPVPGFGTVIDVVYLGDAYQWRVRDIPGNRRAGEMFLQSIIESCIKDLESDSRFEKLPEPVEDIHVFFSLPVVKDKQDTVLDVGVLADIIRSVFKIKVNAKVLTKSLVASFLSGRFDDRAQLCEGESEKGLSVQCILTGKNAYTSGQIGEMTSRNNRNWHEYSMSGCSFDTIPRLAAFSKVLGSKIYFNGRVGDGEPPEMCLRIFVYSHRSANLYTPLGVYAQQELLRNDLLPRFALAIAKLHRPDIFG